MLNSKINNFEGTYSGFYYDQQLANPLMNVTLHPNTKYLGPKNGIDYWGHADNLEPGTNEWRYSLDPIATSILSEDFSVDIVNTWSDFGGDPIADMFNNQKTMAPYLADVAKSLHSISDQTKAENEKTGGNNKIYDVIGKVTEFIANNQEKQAKYLGRALVVNGTKFSYYGGTGINFNNITMKFTIFPKIENNRFITVKEQIIDILPYIIGDYIPVTEAGSFAKEFASWQLPPAGFTADIKSVDTVQKGTFKLRFGTYYSLDNLVINGCNFNFSKTMVKDPTVGAGVYTGTGQNITPMYCDVTLQLKPATKYSRNKLEEFINADDKASEELIKKTNGYLAANLEKIRAANKAAMANMPNSGLGENISDLEISMAKAQYEKDEEAKRPFNWKENMDETFPQYISNSELNWPGGQDMWKTLGESYYSNWTSTGGSSTTPFI